MGTPLKSLQALLSPRVLSPRGLSSVVLTPSVLSPRLLSPKVLSPKVLSPRVLSPRVLSPRVVSPISPLSPNLLSAPRKFENFAAPKLEQTKRSCHVAKRLEFSQYADTRHFKEPIQIKVTDCTADNRGLIVKSDIVINTPNKKNLFENGIERCQSRHTLLGVGSFGTVVRGKYKDETVAVKTVRNAFTLGEKNALNLRHENIVRTLDIIQNPEGNYSLIIMEYFEDSKQLQNLLEDCDFDIETKTLNFAVDICNGLNFLHGKGILHLDLKPQNVLLAENVCKICDFGNSVLVTGTQNFKHHGTAVYTAPELLQGKSPTEKCDMFSLGILLWQLKSRCPPYSEIDNAETVIYKVVKCNHRPENEIPIDDYSKLYKNCWNADPNSRPTVSNVLHTLKSLFF